ncbi:hypothetical protein Q8W71_30225 [Methylobacterium sp. NEAU 140]|uniref:hypothetical protein n=1 Tax=Methylobacterium sp. NEAU 140 TaxID=3064945 RepID=UPI0027338645|nr:hypothetical protein [Methylobacterium sp. NEAU 140]MDP4026875.1 hypothetical protein [Methylobacterium sp. NEAU 140]
MGHSEHDPAVEERRPWNAGRKLGAKRALKPQQVWAVRFWPVPAALMGAAERLSWVECCRFAYGSR